MHALFIAFFFFLPGTQRVESIEISVFRYKSYILDTEAEQPFRRLYIVLPECVCCNKFVSLHGINKKSFINFAA